MTPVSCAKAFLVSTQQQEIGNSLSYMVGGCIGLPCAVLGGGGSQASGAANTRRRVKLELWNVFVITPPLVRNTSKFIEGSMMSKLCDVGCEAPFVNQRSLPWERSLPVIEQTFPSTPLGI